MRKTMNNRQRVIASINHQQPDKIPYAIGFTQKAQQKMADFYGGAGFADQLGNCLTWLNTEPANSWREVATDIWQDQFVYYSGVLATKGITDFFKGTVARQRPFVYCKPDLAARRTDPSQADDHHSFFSGHASAAFYAMTFLNLRVREAMRQDMSPDDYRGKRWIPSTLSSAQ